MEPILFHTESPAFRAVALDPRSRNRHETCSRERHTRLYDEAEENESEMCGARRVREVAAGIKHKTVYIRWRRGPLKGPPSHWIALALCPVSGEAGWSSLASSSPLASLLPLTQTYSLPARHLLSVLTVLLLYSCPSYFPFDGAPRYSPRSSASSTSFDFAFNLLHRLAKSWIPRSDANLCFNWNRKSSVKARTTGRGRTW